MSTPLKEGMRVALPRRRGVVTQATSHGFWIQLDDKPEDCKTWVGNEEQWLEERLEPPDPGTLVQRIAQAINAVSAENGSNTPDFILAGYLTDCLAAFDKATIERSRWYGRTDHPCSAQPVGLEPVHASPPPANAGGLQERVTAWVRAVFTEAEATDVPERSLRASEEAIELTQACGVDRETLHRLVDYVYSRPAGDPTKEIAGCLVTIYAAASALGVDADAELETELARIQQPEVIERCRLRQSEKREALAGSTKRLVRRPVSMRRLRHAPK